MKDKDKSTPVEQDSKPKKRRRKSVEEKKPKPANAAFEALVKAAPVKRCVMAGSRPGYIKMCSIDPNTGACTADCQEFPDPDGHFSAHIMAG